MDEGGTALHPSLPRSPPRSLVAPSLPRSLAPSLPIHSHKKLEGHQFCGTRDIEHLLSEVSHGSSVVHANKETDWRALAFAYTLACAHECVCTHVRT